MRGVEGPSSQRSVNQEDLTLQTPLEIHFTNMERSDAVEEGVRARVERLEQFFDGITSCHVFVDASHRRQRKGNLYEVRIEVRIPRHRTCRQ